MSALGQKRTSRGTGLRGRDCERLTLVTRASANKTAPPALAQAEEPTTTIMVGNNKRSFTRGELLMRPDATTIEVARDVNMVPLHRRNATSPCVRKYSPLRTRLPSVRPPHRTHH